MATNLRHWRVATGAVMVSLVVAGSGSSVCHLSFYTCLGNPFPCHSWGFLPQNQSGWLTTGFTNDTQLIREGAAAGIKSLYYIGDTFFDFGKGLRPDAAARWAAVEPTIEAFVANGSIVGLFVGDELVSGKHITWTDISTALAMLGPIKQRHKQLFVWQNEGGTGWEGRLPNGKLPASLDVISIDDYGLSPNATKEWYKTVLYPVLGEHQRVFLVPGSFGSRVDPTKTLAEFEVDMVSNAKAFFSWAQSDPVVYGIAPWHWEARKVGQTTPYKEVGTSEMPQLRAAWREIGESIAKTRASGACDTFPPST